VTARPSILPVSGGTDSRKLLACLTDRLDDVAELFAFEHTAYANLDATTGEYVVRKVLGRPFRRYLAAEGAAHVPQRPFDRRRFTRLFWLRTSAVAKPPNEHTLGMTAMTPPGHLHLRGNVMDLMRAVWWRSFGDRHALVGVTLRDEAGVNAAQMQGVATEVEKVVVGAKIGVSEHLLPQGGQSSGRGVGRLSGGGGGARGARGGG
jgi:hypothetical protein